MTDLELLKHFGGETVMGTAFMAVLYYIFKVYLPSLVDATKRSTEIAVNQLELQYSAQRKAFEDYEARISKMEERHVQVLASQRDAHRSEREKYLEQITDILQILNEMSAHLQNLDIKKICDAILKEIKVVEVTCPQKVTGKND